MSLFKKKNKGYNPNYIYSTSDSTIMLYKWICRKCGETNRTTEIACKSCGHYK